MPTFETAPLSSVEKPKSHFPLWLIIIIILTLAVSASVLWYVFTHKPGSATPAAPEEKSDGLPAVVNSYTGEISAIGENEITLKAKASENYLTADKILTVKITAETLLSSLSVPKTITDPTKPLNLVKKDIVFKDLKVGQKVVVFTAENIKDKTSLTAASVEVQSVK